MKNYEDVNLVARCRELIKSDGPVVAIKLADKLGIMGNREYKRRRIRAIVQHLRNNCGEKIVADISNGYYLTDDNIVFELYLKERQMSAKKVLGITHKQLKMVCDSAGQGLLFVLDSGKLNNNHFK